MDFGGNYGKRRSIRSEDLFLEVIMIFGEKLQSAPNFKYPPLIKFAQNFIFQNWVSKQKSLRNPDLKQTTKIFKLILKSCLTQFYRQQKNYFN